MIGRRLARPLADLRATLGGPGLLIGLFALLAVAFGLVVLADESGRLRRSGREAMRPIIAGWVRTVPVHYLGLTLPDSADRWRRAPPALRPARRDELRGALDVLGGKFDPLLEVVTMELGPPAGPPLAAWPVPGLRTVSDADLKDRIPVLPAERGQPAIELRLRYRLAPEIDRAAAVLEVSHRRLALAVLGLSAFPLLCLLYMALQARALRDRAAREAAQAATLDLADRTCHELGNVAFVLANERRNLSDHLDLIERFLAESPAALDAALGRAQLDPAQAERLRVALGRAYADRGIDPVVELAASAAIARDVSRQVSVCSDYIALTVRELDAYLKQSALPAQPEPVAVAACLDDALAILGPRLEAASVRVDRPPEAGPVRVLADRRLLVHALVNLLKNALEATAAAGRPPRIVLGVHVEGSTAWVGVADNGPGIPPEALPRIFDLGFSTKGAGRGRGLAIARASGQAQGGRIEVRSRPGAGAEFRIGLPRALEAGPPP